MFFIIGVHKKIIKEFQYLVNDFGFKIIEKSCFSRSIYVKFRSSNCEITVYVEGRNYVGLFVTPLIEISGINAKKDKSFELYHIIDVICPNLHFKETEERNLSKEIKRISYYFLEYCKEIINGDFSVWPTLFKRWNRIT
jgi:hypothetical protein